MKKTIDTKSSRTSRYLAAMQVGEVLSNLGILIASNLSEVLASTSPDGTVSFHTPAATITLSPAIRKGGEA